MTDAAPIVTIIGGSGFVGRYVTQAMAHRGWRVRVGCRRPYEAGFVRTYGVVGQVEPVQVNVRDDASTAAILRGADVAVYAVGVLAEAGRNTFRAVQAEGPERAARLAREAGVGRFVLVSAIGADASSPSEYARTKAAGEAAVLRHYPDAVIVRPSIVFGTEDRFFNRFGAMARLSPVIPIVGGATRFQPVWVEDVAEAVAKAAAGEAAPGTYELGGPEIYTFRQIIELTLRTIGRRRAILDLPFWLGRLQGRVLQHLPNPPLTEDQVNLLAVDNVVHEGAKTFADLGMSPDAPEGIIDLYLVSYAPHGQYSRMYRGTEHR